MDADGGCVLRFDSRNRVEERVMFSQLLTKLRERSERNRRESVEFAVTSAHVRLGVLEPGACLALSDLEFWTKHYNATVGRCLEHSRNNPLAEVQDPYDVLTRDMACAYNLMERYRFLIQKEAA